MSSRPIHLDHLICGCWGNLSGMSSIFEIRSRPEILVTILDPPAGARWGIWMLWLPRPLACGPANLTGWLSLVVFQTDYYPLYCGLCLMYCCLPGVVRCNIGQGTRWETQRGRRFWVRDPKSIVLFAYSLQNPSPTSLATIEAVTRGVEDRRSRGAIKGGSLQRASCLSRGFTVSEQRKRTKSRITMGSS